jgi:tRNA A37 threonylcarbamoyladenosine dehydratase
MEFFTPASAESLLEPGYDYVVDATDKLSNKCLIITGSRERNIPVLTVGGAGGKRDGTAVRVSDLAHSVQDELLRQVRRKLRRDCGFPREPDAPFGVDCVYSPEKPHFPWADGTCSTEPEPGASLKLDCASGFGTATHITAAFGLAAAGAVLGRLVNG